MLLKYVPYNVSVLALIGADSRISELWYRNIRSKRAADILKSDVESTSASEAEVKRAREEVVKIVQQLQAEGKLAEPK